MSTQILHRHIFNCGELIVFLAERSFAELKEADIKKFLEDLNASVSKITECLSNEASDEEGNLRLHST